MELWFLGQGYHLEKAQSSYTPNIQQHIFLNQLLIKIHGSLTQVLHTTANAALFSSMSPLKISNLITSAYGSQIASKGIDQVSLSHSHNLNFVLIIPDCLFNLISKIN